MATMTTPSVPLPATQGITFMPAGNSPPLGAVAGMVYYNDVVQQMMVYDGATWMAIATNNSAPWHLFIDDLRDPADALFDDPETRVARTAEAAIELIDQYGLPKTISFDHDLGEGPTAMHVLWYIIHGCLDERWKITEITYAQVHSANPIGVQNIAGLWNRFCQEEGYENKMNIVPARSK